MKKKLILSILIGLLFFYPLGFVFGIELENPLRVRNFGELIDKIINIIFTLALYLTPLMIIISGIFFVTAAGSPRQIQTAKNILLYSLLGFLIILLAKGIVRLFMSMFGI